MCNILSSISFVNLYTRLATVTRLAVVVLFFFNLASRCVYRCVNNNDNNDSVRFLYSTFIP